MDFKAFDRYLKLNQTVNEVVFDGRFANAPVYLDLEGAVSSEVARRAGLGPLGTVPAVADASSATIETNVKDPFDWHNQMLARWITRGRQGGPPFTALLCALSSAAARMHEDDTHSSHNYYERLFQLWNMRDTRVQDKVRNNFRDTRKYWDALDRWLTDRSFDLGRPTAAQINGFKFVSYSLSQALVRDAERQKIRGMFEEYHFSPGEKISPSEMQLYLHAWLNRSQVSPYLKRVWTNPDLRHRLLEVACLELESWDGTRTDASGHTVQAPRHLQWAASLSRFPRAAIQLHLTLPLSSGTKLGSLKLPQSATRDASTAFAQCASSLRLTELAGEDLVCLSPAAQFNLSALLHAEFELETAQRGVHLRRSSRPIVPLVRYQNGALFREVSRVSFLQPHIILCHERWREKVARHLDRVARKGFRELNAAALRGLPMDWCVFSGVEVLSKPPGQADNDLLDLVPLAESSVSIQDGFHLFDDSWHADVEPEAVAVTDDAPLSVEIRKVENDDRETVVSSVSSVGSSCSLRLTGFERPPGAIFSAVAVRGGKELRRTRFTFESSDTPRPLNLVNVSEMAYVISPASAFGLIGAQADSAETRALLKSAGMSLQGTGSVGTPVGTAPSLRQSDADGFESEIDTVLTLSGGEAAAFQGTSCISRGHHYWLVEPFNRDDNRRDAKWMTCKDCGLKRLSRSNEGRNSGDLSSPSPAVADFAPRSETALRSADLIFDGLCYLGGGRWSRFREICSQGSEEPWYASKLAAQLIAQGHIEVLLNSQTLRPELWRCSSPAIIELAPSSFFLAGYRSKKLIEALRRTVSNAGGRLQLTEQDGAPPAYLIADISKSALEAAVENLKDVHGRAVPVLESPSSKIIANCAPVSALYEILPETYFNAGDTIERFNPGSGRWARAESTQTSGGYRCTSNGVSYAIRGTDGKLRMADYRLAKLCSSSLARIALHSYDADSREFIAALGCEPPALFERALVACSGMLPVRRGRKLRYKNVGRQLADAILNLLYR